MPSARLRENAHAVELGDDVAGEEPRGLGTGARLIDSMRMPPEASGAFRGLIPRKESVRSPSLAPASAAVARP